MLGLIWYFACLIGGFIWVMGSPSISAQLTLGEIIAGGIAVGTIAPAYITYLVSCCLSMLEAQSLIIANGLIVYLVIERLPTFLREARKRVHEGIIKREGWDSILAWSVTAVIGGALYPVWSSRMIPEENGKIYSGGSCWADLPIHMHMAESFLSGRNADVSWGDMHSPVFAGEKMAYPFIPDWHTAVMIKTGGTMRQGFLSTGFIMSLSFWALLYFLALRVTRSRIAGVLAILLTIGSGGQGGINLLMRDGWEKATNTDVIQNDVSGDGKVFWFAFLPHVFFPQRGATFAYPLVLFILLLVWSATDTSARVVSTLQRRGLLVHAAGLCALLPLCQAHSFIGAGLVIVTIFVLDAHKWLADLSLLWSWVLAGVVAAVLGGPQMLLFKNQAMHGHGGNFIQYGWIYKNHEFGQRTDGTPFALIPFGLGNFFRFWWMSLGPAVPLCFLSIAIIAAECACGHIFAMSLRAQRKSVVAYIQAANRRIGIDTTTAAAAGGATGASSGPGSSGSHASASDAKKRDSDGEGDASASSTGIANGQAARKRFTATSATGAGNAGGYVDSDADEAVPSYAASYARLRPADVDTGSDDVDSYAGKGWPALASDAFVGTGTGSHGIAGPDVSLAEHLCYIAYSQLPSPVQDVLSGATPLNTFALENAVGHMNALTVTRRGLDSLKLALAGLLVFMVGNYINFQPWDRDNCKLYYIWVFINTITVGGLLAAPIEFVLGIFPGYPRMLQTTSFAQPEKIRETLEVGIGMEAGGVVPSVFNSLVASATGGASFKPERAFSAPAVASTPAASGARDPTASVSTARMVTTRLVSFGGLLSLPVLLFLLCASGFMCLYREAGPGMYHQLLDEDQLAVGKYIKENIAPKAVFMHRDIHITPAGCLAGRPTLVGYTGWMWSHGYNYYDRDRDRNFALQNVLKDSDQEAYNALRRWGVRYVLGEWLQRHHRPQQQEWEEANARRNANPSDPTIIVPPFDPDMYLDGQLRRVFSAGRYDVLEVLGYGFAPN